MFIKKLTNYVLPICLTIFIAFLFLPFEKVNIASDTEHVLKFLIIPLVVIIGSFILKLSLNKESKQAHLPNFMLFLLTACLCIILAVHLINDTNILGGNLDSGVCMRVAIGLGMLGVFINAFAFALPLWSNKEKFNASCYVIGVLFSVCLTIFIYFSAEGLTHKTISNDLVRSFYYNFFLGSFGVVLEGVIAVFIIKSNNEKIVEVEKVREVIKEIYLNKPVTYEVLDQSKSVSEIKIPKRVINEEEQEERFKPSYRALCRYVLTLKDVVKKENDNKTVAKFYHNKKMFLTISNSEKFYRIAFLYDLEQVPALLVKFPGDVTKAKTPKGANWFKLKNKGQFTELDLTMIINKAYDLPEIMKQKRINDAKERRRQQAKKRKEEAKNK